MADRPETAAERLRSLAATACAFAYLVPGTLVLGTLAVLLSWVPPRGEAMMLLARVWSRCLLAAAGVRVRVEEAAPPAAPGGCVFLANHQSYFDIPALLATVPRSVRFAAKRSLFRIPVFGWALAAGGFIPVDRADRSRARDVWAAAGRRLAAGASVLFFPEGTRSADGRVAPFQRGGFLVALKSGAPIVPVGVSGSRRVLPRGRFRVSPGTIDVRYGAAVDPAEYGVARKGELIARVQGEVERLVGAAPGVARERGP
jgi:1-acyl-sn-glycerol-3-phosphate acyltransferase